nr:uncharacterized protein LOC127295374 [Lolium perenne]
MDLLPGQTESDRALPCGPRSRRAPRKGGAHRARAWKQLRFLYKAPRLASNGNSPATPSPKLSCPAAPDPSVAADELTGDARDASMTTSRRLADRKTAKFQKNITKRGSVPETTVKKGNDYPVGPIVLGFFIFVVIGSSLFQIIRTASSGGLA